MTCTERTQGNKPNPNIKDPINRGLFFLLCNKLCNNKLVHFLPKVIIIGMRVDLLRDIASA